MRVLVVDDSSFTRSVVTKIFRDLGVAALDEAINGIEAIRKLNANRYNLVTVDLVMPSSSGMDVIKHVKQVAPATKIIVCSSVSDRETILQIIKLGIDDFILKPFSEGKAKNILEKKLAECGKC